jgi:transcription elongation GreA/GreB family factor
MNKKELKKFLIENEYRTIENTEERLLEFVKGTMLNRNDVIDQDDQSHHRQEERLRNKLDEQVHDHHHHLEEIEALRFNPSDVVEPGAVIKVNDRYMVIATADGNFKFDGKDFISISTKAPIYQCMMGKKKGDMCSFNNHDFKIEEIY